MRTACLAVAFSIFVLAVVGCGGGGGGGGGGGAPPAPVADFTATQRSGFAPLTVTFTDASSGSITSYAWNFGAGASPATAYTQGPHSVTYNAAGIYTVSLTVTGPGGADTETKTDYITVAPPGGVMANFSATPTSGIAPLTVTFTDASAGNITSWEWDFGEGATPATADTQGPHSVTYSTKGLKTVSLTVTGPDGSDNRTKVDDINVLSPYSLTVASVYGIANPSVGTHPYKSVQKVVASVDSPVSDPVTPGVRYFCTGWTGSGSVPGYGNGTSVTFTVSRPSSITWNWAAKYTLTVTCSPVGAGTVARDPDVQWYDSGTVVTLTAAAAAGFAFNNWSGDSVTNPDNPSTPETVQIIIDGPKSVVANFTGTGTFCNLTISSPRDNPVPPAGTYSCVAGTQVTASVDDVFDPGTGTRYVCTGYKGEGTYNCVAGAQVTASVDGIYIVGTGTRYVCTGYAGTGDCPSGAGASTTFVIGSDSSVAWNWVTQYRLTITANPVGAGTVEQSPYTPWNDKWYDTGTVVTLTAAAAAGFAFNNWSGDLSGTANPQTLTMDGPKNVVANFTGAGTYTLTISSPYGNPDPPAGTYSCVAGTQVAASVDDFVDSGTGARYVCTGYTGTGSCLNGTDRFVIFLIGTNSSVTWTWMVRYKLIVTCKPIGAGTVTRSPDSQWYDSGTVVTLSAAAAAGFAFSNWSDGLSGSVNPKNITMDGPKTVVAVFTTGTSPVYYKFGVESSYGNPDPPAGSIQSGSGTSVTFTINRDSSITWLWRTEHRLVTAVLPGGAGRITRNPDFAWYVAGTTVELTAEHSLGFAFFNWSGSLTSSDNPATLTMDGFKSVTANFTGLGTFFTLTISSLHEHAEPPAGSYNLLPGTEVTVRVDSPVEEGGVRYICEGWSGGSGDIPPTGTGTSWTFTITQDSALTWEWTLSFLLTINILPAGAGTVSRNPNQMWFGPDTDVILTATPEAGFAFASWTGDLSGTTPSRGIVMNGPKVVNANFSVQSDRTWVQRGPSGGALTRPDARHSYAMAYDSSRGVVVLFGGNANYVYSNDTWEWDGAHWQLVDIPGSKPSARYGHSLAYDAGRGRVVLFGGYDGEYRLNDTWEYDGNSWVQVNVNPKPPARYYAAMTYDPARAQIVLFGGNQETAARTSDTWVFFYSGATPTWVNKTPSYSPSPRNASAMAFDRNRVAVVLHGGQVDATNPNAPWGNSSNDTWEWNGTNWMQVGNGPSISWHSMAFDSVRGRIVLFGGWQGGYSGTRKNETWERTGVNWVLKTPSPKPPERDMHCLAYDDARGVCVLFGGDGSTAMLNDTWVWNGESWRDPISNPLPTCGCTLTYDSARLVDVLFGGVDGTSGVVTNATWEWYDGSWSQPQSSTDPPPARENHSAAFDAAHQVTVIFGGQDSAPNLRNDTWTWDGSKWTQKSTSPTPPVRYFHAMAYDSSRNVVVMFGGYGAGYLGDTWEWDGTNWSQRASGGGPSPRYMHAMVYDSYRHRVVLYGGYNGTDLSDTWEWNGAAWSQIALLGPSARSEHAMAYDSSRRVVVLFGGSVGEPPEYLGDTWEYNGAIWYPIATGAAPSPRDLHAMCYDANRATTVLFGGFDGTDYRDDTWEYSRVLP